MRRLCWLVVMLGLLTSGAFSQSKALTLPRPSFPLKYHRDSVKVPILRWRCPEERKPVKQVMLRSSTDLRTTQDTMAFPIAEILMEPDDVNFRDDLAPQDVLLFYQVKMVFADGETLYSDVLRVVCEAKPIAHLSRPQILVDKAAYTLQVIDGRKIVACMPIALGANPRRRKLHLDHASTPEGAYRISGVQPRATYYRAFDLDYPNQLDQIRYREAIKGGTLPAALPDIGGEIQIHGQGIESNWTWGCVALRDRDMDRLFAIPELEEGVRVFITGPELGLEDIRSEWSLTDEEKMEYCRYFQDLGIPADLSEKGWQTALCRYQSKNGLNVTGMLDLTTRKLVDYQMTSVSTR